MFSFYDQKEIRQAGKLGKLAPKAVKLKSLREYLTDVPLPIAPKTFDYAPKVSSFPMALNDQLGDCTIAGIVHLLQLAYAEVDEVFTCPSDDEIKQTYFELTGGADTGCVEADVLSKWQKDGLFGTKIIAWSPVDIRDLDLMKRACFAFGGLYLGVELPAEAQTQFANHRPWATGLFFHDQPIGGHCVVGSGFNSLGGDVITWGAEQSFTSSWWSTYGSECCVVIPEIFAEKKHGPLASIDVDSLTKDIEAL